MAAMTPSENRIERQKDMDYAEHQARQYGRAYVNHEAAEEYVRHYLGLIKFQPEFWWPPQPEAFWQWYRGGVQRKAVA